MMISSRLKIPIAIFSSILTGLICNAIWLYGITVLKSWHGLTWLSGFPNAVFSIIPLIVFNYIFIYWMFKRPKFTQILLAFSILCIVSFVTFFLYRMFCYNLYSRFSFMLSRSAMLLNTLVPLVSGIFTFSFGFYLTTNKLLSYLPKKTIVFFLLSLISSLLLGLVTIHFYRGYGTSANHIDMIKMGYPIFWITAILGFFAMTFQKYSKSENDIEILDLE